MGAGSAGAHRRDFRKKLLHIRTIEKLVLVPLRKRVQGITDPACRWEGEVCGVGSGGGGACD